MQLSAPLDVVGIVLALMIIVTGYVLSSHRQSSLLKKIEHKLVRFLRDLGKGKRNADDTDNT